MNDRITSPGGVLQLAPVSGGAPEPPLVVAGALDALRLQAQCAQAVEGAPVDAARSLVELLRRLLHAHAVAWLAHPADPAPTPDFVSSARGGSPAALLALRAMLDAERAQATPAAHLGLDCYTLSTPVLREGTPRGWLVAQLPVRNPRDLQAFLVLLQVASGYLLYAEQRRISATWQAGLERASELLEIFRSSGAEGDFEQASRHALDALAAELGCARIFFASHRRGRWRLQAISGLSQLDWRSAAHRTVEAAMREATVTSQPLEWTPDHPCLPATAAHELLGQELGASRLRTLPLAGRRGALLFLWTGEAGRSDAPAQRAGEAAAPFVPVLFDLLQRARPHPLLYGLHRGWANLSRHRQHAALALTLALGALLACPFHYTLHVGCRLVPVTKQIVAAPFQAQLKHSLVRPGDRVTLGQPLGELDSRELKMKEAELLAARERALKQRDRALANQGEGSDFAAAQVAGFEAQSVGQDLALVQRKLSELEVRAPLAGTIVSGDLRRAEGQPVQQGQILWEVAPLEEMIVELEVPDRDIAHVGIGQPVQVRLEALRGTAAPTTLQRVHPQSEPSEGQNVFIAEAPVRATAASAELRPGMRGRATITTARQPLLWILGHRLWEWAVTTLLWT